MLTLTEATEQTGKSKSTLTRAIKSGRLSAQRNEHGDYRVEPSELFRVFEPMASHDEPKAVPEQGAVVADLLDMVKTKDSENAELRDELEETKERLDEHREAARALMSPEDLETRLSAALKIEKAEQAKQERRWQVALADRKQEIEQARLAADELRERERQTRAELEAMDKRGLIDRLLNRKPIIAEG